MDLLSRRQPRGSDSPFCPGWCYQPGQKGDFCPDCQTRDKRASRSGVPGWETGTTEISQPGQISIFVVVIEPHHHFYFSRSILSTKLDPNHTFFPCCLAHLEKGTPTVFQLSLQL